MFQIVMNWLRRLVAVEPIVMQAPSATAEQRLATVLITTLMEAMKKEAEAGTDEPLKLCMRLAEIILPEVVTGEVTKGAAPVSRAQAKLWAQACAQMIGMLAGMSVKSGRTDAAITELLSQAKTAADRYAGMSGGTVTPSAPAAPTVDVEKLKADAARTERLSVIKDLETQAENESNADARTSMLRLAELMRKELEQGKVA